jgi:hypothetical protein
VATARRPDEVLAREDVKQFAGVARLNPGHTRSAGDVLNEAEEALDRAKRLRRRHVDRKASPAD